MARISLFSASFPDRPTTIDSISFPPTKLLITITDCEYLRSHAYFVVRANGVVKEIRNI